MSPHLMSDMALTAEHFTIVGRGRLIADMSGTDLTAMTDPTSVRARSPHAGRLRGLLAYDATDIVIRGHDLFDVVGWDADEHRWRTSSSTSPRKSWNTTAPPIPPTAHANWRTAMSTINTALVSPAESPRADGLRAPNVTLPRLIRSESIKLRSVRSRIATLRCGSNT
jgi:hypothetical protein